MSFSRYAKKLEEALWEEYEEPKLRRNRKTDQTCTAFKVFKKMLGIDTSKWNAETGFEPDSAHEIAHWMLSSPSKRWKHDFGLKRADLDIEYLAAILGVLLLKEHGLDWHHEFWLYERNAKLHGDHAPELALLMKMRLIDKDGRPTFLRATS